MFANTFKNVQTLNLLSNRLIWRYYSVALQQNVRKKRPHQPVMVKQVLEYLKPEKDQVFIDMTFGAGGHSQAILDSSDLVKIIALDRDPTGYEHACKMSEKYPGRIIPLLGRFSELPPLLKDLKKGHNSIDGILFDFGCSSMQFDTPSRGFSVSADGPLDMRMDQDRIPKQISAKEVLEKCTEDDLARIFKVYGEEKHYKKIAAAIVDFRHTYGRLETTHQLSSLVDSVFEDDEERVDKLNRPTHPATKIFQALRIFVNNELNEINYGMLVAQKYLKVGGRLVTLTFHSLEDTIVKRHLTGNMFNSVANKVPLKYVSHSLVYNQDAVHDMLDTNWQSLTQHVVIPSLLEIELNPRCRSASLRAAIKIK